MGLGPLLVVPFELRHPCERPVSSRRVGFGCFLAAHSVPCQQYERCVLNMLGPRALLAAHFEAAHEHERCVSRKGVGPGAFLAAH